jgi:hypothetical protein
MTSKGMAHFQAELSDSEVNSLIEMALLALFENDQIPFAVVDEDSQMKYHATSKEKQ